MLRSQSEMAVTAIRIAAPNAANPRSDHSGSGEGRRRRTFRNTASLIQSLSSRANAIIDRELPADQARSPSVCFSQHLYRSATPKIPGYAQPGHHSDSGTHHLNRGHQRPSQECSPKKAGPKLRARNRTCGDAGWVIVGSSGDNARAKPTSTAIASIELEQMSARKSWNVNRLRITARIHGQSCIAAVQIKPNESGPM
jgi:hypothetical protein